MSETVYQARLIRRIEREFPGCFVIRNNPDFVQGIPDLIILFGSSWAMLEVKVSRNAKVQPNQQYYVSKFGEMSYCSFIYPENEERVMYELQQAFCA